jgi:hypothetical protein
MMADERDSKVSRRYRELGSEEPPSALDEAILAAARRSARQRWYYVFGAAAIMVLAVAVTVQVERQRPDPELVAEAPVPVEPPKAESRLESAPTPKREAPPRELARDTSPETAAQARSQVQENNTADVQKPEARAESAPRPMAAPAAPAESRADENTLGAASSRGEPGVGARQPSQAAAPAARARMAEEEVESPERWLERIVQLRKEGRHEEAEKQLAEFRKRYPDYKVPESALK